MTATVRARASLVETWAGPIVMAATLVVIVGWSWNRWPDLVVDFWREVYIA